MAPVFGACVVGIMADRQCCQKQSTDHSSILVTVISTEQSCHVRAIKARLLIIASLKGQSQTDTRVSKKLSIVRTMVGRPYYLRRHAVQYDLQPSTINLVLSTCPQLFCA